MESPFRLVLAGAPHPLDVASFDGREKINGCFSYDIVVHMPLDDPRAFEAAAFDKDAELRIAPELAHRRRVTGVIARVEWLGQHAQDRIAFSLRLVPRLARLKRRRTSRIFQDASVPEVIDEILNRHAVPRRWTLAGELPRRAYCVQHRETDYGFVRRLLAEEGLFFFFEDATDARPEELLTIIDVADAYTDIAGDPVLVYRGGDGGAALTREERHVRRAALRRAARSTSVLTREYDYERPRVTYSSAADAPTPLGLIEAGVRALEPGADVRERAGLHYEHHGDYERAEVDRNAARGLLEQLRAKSVSLRAESSCKRLSPGHRFTLTEHELSPLDILWVVDAVEHKGRSPMLAQGGDIYENRFSAVPAATPLRPRPPRRAPTQVAETAIVVGPAGHEIHTDELGRIKVQFHWDLEGNHDERSSCWIRVAQAWAGEGFGAQFIPRVGMEVLVTFLGGDLDRPVVTGCLYNAVQPPAFQLPHAQVTSGIRTRSSPGGGGQHELSFNDAAGAEVITLRSQRDMELASRRDLEANVGGDRTTRVGGDDRVEVKGDRSVAVEGASRAEVRGDREVEVEMADQLTVGEGRTTRVGGLESAAWDGGAAFESGRSYALSVHDNFSLAIGCGQSAAQTNVSGTYTVGASKAVTLLSDERITLRVGLSVIEIEPGGITLRAPTIAIKGIEEVTAEANGPRLSLGDDAELVSKVIRLFSEKARLELDRDAIVKGDKVLLNCKSRDPASELSVALKKKKSFKVQLTDADFEPYASKHFELLAGGDRIEGETTDDGNVEVYIPDDATLVDLTAWLDAYPTGRRRTWQIQIAPLPPAKAPSGALQRLANLGYFSGAPGEELTEEGRTAVRWFQKDHELDETGELNDATAAELTKVHGG